MYQMKQIKNTSSKKWVLSLITISNILIIFSSLSYAQQEPQYSMYQYNPTLINPAFSGYKESGSVNLGVRSQWVGFEGAPKTAMFSAHAPVMRNTIGVGLNFIADKAGARNLNILQTNLCYNLKLTSRLILGVGFAPSLQMFRFRYDQLTFKNNETNSSAFSLNTINKSVFDMNIGILLRTKTFFVGYTASNIMDKPVFEMKDTLNKSVKYRMRTHGYFTIGKSFQINENLIFAPTVLYRSASDAGNMNNLDFNLNFFIQKTVWLGLLYRTSGGPGFLVQFYAGPKLKIGYSFDTGNYKNIRLNSHEICLSFDLKKSTAKIVSPRFF